MRSQVEDGQLGDERWQAESGQAQCQDGGDRGGHHWAEDASIGLSSRPRCGGYPMVGSPQHAPPLEWVSGPGGPPIRPRLGPPLTGYSLQLLEGQGPLG